MDRAHRPTYKPVDHGWWMRVFAVLFSCWMCMVPQVMGSSTVKALCEEAGSTPLPLIEEEEVGHALSEPLQAMHPNSSEGVDDTLLPHREDRPLRSLHGEVPHLPPWS